MKTFTIPVEINCDTHTAVVGGTVMRLRPDMRIKEDRDEIDELVRRMKNKMEEEILREVYAGKILEK